MLFQNKITIIGSGTMKNIVAIPKSIGKGNSWEGIEREFQVELTSDCDSSRGA